LGLAVELLVLVEALERLERMGQAEQVRVPVPVQVLVLAEEPGPGPVGAGEVEQAAAERVAGQVGLEGVGLEPVGGGRVALEELDPALEGLPVAGLGLVGVPLVEREEAGLPLAGWGQREPRHAGKRVFELEEPVLGRVGLVEAASMVVEQGQAVPGQLDPPLGLGPLPDLSPLGLRHSLAHQA
jgi:hypothetical protein